MQIQIKKLPHCYSLPTKGTKESAGYDLYAAVESSVIIKPNEVLSIPTGIVMSLSNEGEDLYEAQVRSRSGLSLKHSILVLNSPGTIDADFRGEVSVILVNRSSVNFVVERGMRVAQMVVQKVERCSFIEVEEIVEFSDNQRKEGGFGSTGV